MADCSSAQLTTVLGIEFAFMAILAITCVMLWRWPSAVHWGTAQRGADNLHGKGAQSPSPQPSPQGLTAPSQIVCSSHNPPSADLTDICSDTHSGATGVKKQKAAVSSLSSCLAVVASFPAAIGA